MKPDKPKPAPKRVVRRRGLRKPRGKPGARTAKAKQLLDLGLSLELAPRTYTQIEEELGISRSTAYRLMRELRDLVGDSLKEVASEELGQTVFSVRLGATGNLAAFGREDVVALEEAAKMFARADRKPEAERLARVAKRVLASLHNRTAAAVDVSELVSREGLAMRSGPQPVIDTAMLAKLRYALLAPSVVEIDYVSRNKGTRASLCLEPAGLLFGVRNYLVAFREGRDDHEPRLYALPGIKALEIKDRSFAMRKDFDLQSFVEQSYGVWQGDTVDATLVFKARRHNDVMETRFHKTERKEVLEDGSIRVTFRASGQEEILHHLFFFKDTITFIDPPELRRRYRDWLAMTLAGVEAMDSEAPGPAAAEPPPGGDAT